MYRFYGQLPVFLVICAGSALAQAVVPARTDLWDLRRGTGAAPELPEIAPQPVPKPSITTPAPAPAESGAPLSTAPLFELRAIKIEGKSTLDERLIQDVVAPFIGKQISIGGLEDLRRQLTLLFINRGYINSGFTIPD